MIFRQLFNPADSAMTYLIGDPASGEAVVIDPLKYQATLIRGFAQALPQLPAGSLMMCHPGHHADDPDDLIATARVAEFRYLASPAFAEHCQQQNVEIGRFCLK